MIHRMSQEIRKFLITENFEAAFGRYFTDGMWMESMSVVADSRLDEYWTVRNAFCTDFSAHIS